MKLLHTSDWHLGRSEGVYSLEEDQRFFIDEICRIAAEKEVDAVLIAGDVYDRAIASKEAIKLYDYAMRRLCLELGVRVYVIAGNHDSAERLESLKGILAKSGLHVLGALEACVDPQEEGDAQIYLLPWITEEKVKSLFPLEKDKITDLEDAYRVVCGHMKESFDPSKRHILLSHAYVTDSETSRSDLSAEIGTASMVDKSVFEDFDYVALGHLHKPQDITPKIRYSGTPMPYSFGKEEDQEKNVTLLDTATMKCEIIPLPLFHRRKTLENTAENLLSSPVTQEERESYIRILVTDQFMTMELYAALKERYPNLLEASGKSFEVGESGIAMTMEEFESIERSPLEVFKRFCTEMGTDPDEHLIALFAQAVEEVEKEER